MFIFVHLNGDTAELLGYCSLNLLQLEMNFYA